MAEPTPIDKLCDEIAELEEQAQAYDNAASPLSTLLEAVNDCDSCLSTRLWIRPTGSPQWLGPSTNSLRPSWPSLRKPKRTNTTSPLQGNRPPLPGGLLFCTGLNSGLGCH